jgi:hypothetical protein
VSNEEAALQRDTVVNCRHRGDEVRSKIFSTTTTATTTPQRDKKLREEFMMPTFLQMLPSIK